MIITAFISLWTALVFITLDRDASRARSFAPLNSTNNLVSHAVAMFTWIWWCQRFSILVEFAIQSTSMRLIQVMSNLWWNSCGGFFGCKGRFWSETWNDKRARSTGLSGWSTGWTLDIRKLEWDLSLSQGRVSLWIPQLNQGDLMFFSEFNYSGSFIQ